MGVSSINGKVPFGIGGQYYLINPLSYFRGYFTKDELKQCLKTVEIGIKAAEFLMKIVI